jgi:hypothetical protein
LLESSAMTTCRQIITMCLRQGKVLAAGVDPDPSEADDGMVALQGLYLLWLSTGLFGRLTDVYSASDYTASEGERVTAPAGVTITIPDTVTDTIDGTTRAPRDLACIETIIDGARTVKLFDRTGWVDLLDLTLDSTAPLAERSQFGLAAALGLHGGLLQGFNGVPQPMLARAFVLQLSYKLGSTRDRAAAEYF